MVLKDETPMQFLRRVAVSVCTLLQSYFAGKCPKDECILDVIYLGSDLCIIIINAAY
jgi:hypothetical protein